MRIIEKKCPNCGANLDFNVGERNVSCASCRRKFAIMYDHGEDINKLRAEDFDLKTTHGKVIFAIAIVMVIGFATTGVLMAIHNHQAWLEEKERIDNEAEEMMKKMDLDQKAEYNQQKIDELNEIIRNSIEYPEGE